MTRLEKVVQLLQLQQTNSHSPLTVSVHHSVSSMHPSSRTLSWTDLHNPTVLHNHNHRRWSISHTV